MTLLRLALKDLSRNESRSWMVFACALLIAAMVVAASLMVQGMRDSLRLTQSRLGADLIVVARGSAAQVESALLMGGPSTTWLPESSVREIGAVRGVEAVSPQLYLATLSGASCCSVSSMFIVAFDPASDFTVQPWLEEKLGRGLRLHEAVGGTFVSVPDDGEGLRIYGVPLELRGNLEPTGGNLDQSIFVTFETARDVAAQSVTTAEKPLALPSDGVSSVLVKTSEGVDPEAVAAAISHEVTGTSVILSPKMFDRFRDEISGLMSALAAMVAVTIGLALALVALIFSMAAHERRREIGVWRALGATGFQVAVSFVAQAGVLACAGGMAGAAFAALAVYLFHDYLVGRIGVPFLLPAPGYLAVLLLGGVLAAVVVAVCASLAPALRASRLDPAWAMRE